FRLLAGRRGGLRPRRTRRASRRDDLDLAVAELEPERRLPARHSGAGHRLAGAIEHHRVAAFEWPLRVQVLGQSPNRFELVALLADSRRDQSRGQPYARETVPGVVQPRSEQRAGQPRRGELQPLTSLRRTVGEPAAQAIGKIVEPLSRYGGERFRPRQARDTRGEAFAAELDRAQCALALPEAELVERRGELTAH